MLKLYKEYVTTNNHVNAELLSVFNMTWDISFLNQDTYQTMDSAKKSTILNRWLVDLPRTLSAPRNYEIS